MSESVSHGGGALCEVVRRDAGWESRTGCTVTRRGSASSVTVAASTPVRGLGVARM
jgi:hypothetical protein